MKMDVIGAPFMGTVCQACLYLVKQQWICECLTEYRWTKMTLLNKCNLAKTSYSAGILDRRPSQILIESFNCVYLQYLRWDKSREATVVPLISNFILFTNSVITRLYVHFNGQNGEEVFWLCSWRTTSFTVSKLAEKTFFRGWILDAPVPIKSIILLSHQWRMKQQLVVKI